MKLAEALRIRADLDRKMKNLKERIKNSARIQEGDVPPEDAEKLMMELDECLVKWEELVYKINYTNMQTKWGSKTLTFLIARKDRLSVWLKMHKEILDHVSAGSDRYGRNEIKSVRTIDVVSLQKEYDDNAEFLRELDLELQELNWKTDLIE